MSAEEAQRRARPLLLRWAPLLAILLLVAWRAFMLANDFYSTALWLLPAVPVALILFWDVWRTIPSWPGRIAHWWRNP